MQPERSMERSHGIMPNRGIEMLGKLHHTRFKGLHFRKCGADWRFIHWDGSDGHDLCTVGGFYHSKAELLGDLGRFAESRGYIE